MVDKTISSGYPNTHRCVTQSGFRKLPVSSSAFVSAHLVATQALSLTVLRCAMSFNHFFYAYALGAVVCSASVFQVMAKEAELNLTLVPQSVFAHTHTSTPKTEPAPLLIAVPSVPSAFQTAGVCFIGFGGCGNDGHFNKGSSGGSSEDDFNIDSKKQCANEGFNVTSCPAGSAAFGICPYDNKYFTGCKSYDELCKQDNYFKTCTGNTVKDPSQSCQYDSSYKKCEPKEELCQNEGYNASCEDGKIQDPGQACPYDGSYQKCVCNPCDGYDYTYAEANEKGYEIDGTACVSCGVDKYKRKAKECLGFVPCDCGGEIGATECWSARQQMFTSCKECKKECTSGEINLDSYWCDGALKCLFGSK